MTSLLDIAPLMEEYTIRRGQKTTVLSVVGIAVQDLAPLLNEFPEIRTAMSGSVKEETLDALIKSSPRIVSKVIVLGTGGKGTNEELAAADKLALGEKFDIIRAILRLTFPQGVGPFVADLASLAREINVGVDPETVAPVTNSSAPSSG